MVLNSPTLLALDFDGVVCDGLLEYFQTAWRSYCHIWLPDDLIPPAGLAEQFYQLRPVVETGWEMPLVLRAVLKGIPATDILLGWSTICAQLVQQEGLVPKEVEATVDRLRDEWIAADLEGWLALHRFYPGVIDRIQQILNRSTHLFIITTKEERFVHQLLAKAGVDLAEAQIFGKSVRRPKAETLRYLRQQFNQEPQKLLIWFVEDRLKTLQSIAALNDLHDVQLFLADWGYNTPADRVMAQQDDRVHLISLHEFTEDFASWA
jgi:phosphoglycolate phosphatase-like HAD superfamily hydrolase